jgi:hypothetical protein
MKFKRLAPRMAGSPVARLCPGHSHQFSDGARAANCVHCAPAGDTDRVRMYSVSVGTYLLLFHVLFDVVCGFFCVHTGCAVRSLGSFSFTLLLLQLTTSLTLLAVARFAVDFLGG